MIDTINTALRIKEGYIIQGTLMQFCILMEPLVIHRAIHGTLKRSDNDRGNTVSMQMLVNATSGIGTGSSFMWKSKTTIIFFLN